MNKYFVGLALGAVAGALGMWLYIGDTPTPAGGESLERRAPSVPVPTLQPQAHAKPTVPSPPPNSAGQSAAGTPAQESGTEHISKTSPPAAEGAAPRTAVPLSKAHAALVKESGRHATRGEPTIENYHQQLEQEDRNDGWAYTMEENLRAYLAKHAPTPNFDVLAIQCRSTMCELQTLGYVEGSGKEWNQIMADMRQEPWWAFTGTSSSSSEENGYSVLLTVLHKP